MLAKKQRLSRAEFLPYLRGRRFEGQFVSVLFTSATLTKVGVVISKKVAPKAVDRNRLRRRTYGIIERFLRDNSFPGVGVFMFKKGALTATRATLQAELLTLLVKVVKSR